MLKFAGQRISCVFKEKGFIGRIGGDEFLGFIPNLAEQNELSELAESFIEKF